MRIGRISIGQESQFELLYTGMIYFMLHLSIHVYVIRANISIVIIVLA